MVAAFSLLSFYSTKKAVERRMAIGDQTPHIQHVTATTSLFAKFLCMMRSVAVNAVRLASCGHITTPLPTLSSDNYRYETCPGLDGNIEVVDWAKHTTMTDADYTT